MMKMVLIATLFLAATAQAAFKCKDERGVTHFGDTPPPGCAKVTMYEISRSGKVLREIAPTPTEEQLKARNDDAARLKEEERAAAQRRRKDFALLSTYGSEADIDTSRELNLKPIETRLKSAQARSVEIDNRLKALETEKEFYTSGRSSKASGKSGALPPQLVADFERVHRERTTLATAIAGYEKEILEVRERFDADKRRWMQLKELQHQGKLDIRTLR